MIMNNTMPTGYRAMLSTPHYLASQIGCSILRQGGNAFDASIAISSTLAVVYPHMTGLGGDAFFLMYDGKSRKLVGLNGSGRAGRQVTPDVYAQFGLDAIPHRGVLSAITVPGLVDAWWEVWSAYGRLPWERLLEPARQFAEEGLPISRDLHHWMCKDEEWLRSSRTLSKLYFCEGKLMQQGDRFTQPELAETLRMLQSLGRDGFYNGPIMESIVSAIRKDGGLLTEDDFRSHRSSWVEPILTNYRENTICQMPPNSQGFSVLMMLNMLERTDLSKIKRKSAEFYHLMAEVVKKAFHDRDQYLTDPEFKEIPLKQLLSKDYAAHLFREIPLFPPSSTPHYSPAIGQDTAYAAVVDEEGNAVSFIQSLYFDFGSAYVAGTSGVIMQNRGSFFSLDANHPNVLQPNKRSFHTLMPGMILRENKPYMLMGTQGGEGQPQTQLSLITGVLDYACSIQEAISLPRWVYGRTWGQDSDKLRLENRNMESEVEKLKQWGHDVEVLGPWDGIMGQAQGIVIDGRGLLSGAADPRGDGMAIGW
jgi:gamma-glutamyltranspeptidase/glutathione hydrolase